MKSRKHRFENFLFYDFTGIERHLERMARRGWQLTKITRLYWEYSRTEPQKLTFAITYFPEASDFNPYPTDNQQALHDYCKEAGWQLAAEWAQMQIFSSNAENPTPIETEEPVKLKVIHRSMLKNYLPASVLMLLLSLLQIYLKLHRIANAPVYALSNGWALFSAAIFSLMTVLILLSLIGYTVWYFKSKKAVKTGGHCAEIGVGHRKAPVVMLGIIGALTVLFMLLQSDGWLVIVGIIGVTAIMALVLVIQSALKRMEVSRDTNIGVTIISIVVLYFILTGVATSVANRSMRTGRFSNQPVETYTATLHNVKHTMIIYNDPLPLTLEDLQEVDYAHYSYEWTARESFLLAKYSGRQSCLPGSAPELNYSIIVVKWPPLFNLCLNEYLNLYNVLYKIPQIVPDLKNAVFLKTDDAAWQADAVYQLYDKDEVKADYILCWGNRIVYINFDDIPTSEQIAIATEKLRQ